MYEKVGGRQNILEKCVYAYKKWNGTKVPLETEQVTSNLPYNTGGKIIKCLVISPPLGSSGFIDFYLRGTAEKKPFH